MKLRRRWAVTPAVVLLAGPLSAQTAPTFPAAFIPQFQLSSRFWAMAKSSANFACKFPVRAVLLSPAAGVC